MKQILVFLAVGFLSTMTILAEANSVEILDTDCDFAFSVEIPRQVLDAFVASFVFEEGYFRGAQVDMLWPYLSGAEIVNLVRGYINYPDPNQVDVWVGFKVTPRGCKQNFRWVCIFSDNDM
jgi:hypothetical protein